jgi:hypothetical protein
MLVLLTLTFMREDGIRIFKETELRVSGDTNDSFVCLKLRITPHTRDQCIVCPHTIAYVVVLHSEEKRKKKQWPWPIARARDHIVLGGGMVLLLVLRWFLVVLSASLLT